MGQDIPVLLRRTARYYHTYLMVDACGVAVRRRLRRLYSGTHPRTQATGHRHQYVYQGRAAGHSAAVLLLRGAIVAKGLDGFLGYHFDPRNPPYFPAAVLALGLNFGAYITDVVVSSVRAIDHGQIEAGKACGMRRREIIWHILLPQVVVVSIPDMAITLYGCSRHQRCLSGRRCRAVGHGENQRQPELRFP